MADGCNLYLSDKDLKQITNSLNQKQICEVAESVKSIMDGFSKGMSQKVTYPLSNPNHPAHKVFSAYVLRNVVGNKSIPDVYKRELPKAVATIAKVTPDVLGLVRPAKNWGPGALSIDVRLGHKTRGAGFAYELLGTASLIEKESKAMNGPSKLKIYPSDRIDLGIKLQARYPGAEAVLTSQPKRRTVEADLFISRPTSIFDGGFKNIGVDFKHSMNSGTYSGRISVSEIEGRKVALMTGEIDEFHYVSNGTFSKNVRETIDKANIELRETGKNDSLISYHENVKYGNI